MIKLDERDGKKPAVCLERGIWDCPNMDISYSDDIIEVYEIQSFKN